MDAFAELHWTCGHTTTSPVIGSSHDNPHRTTPCWTCQQSKQAAATAAHQAARRNAQATTGPLATPAQIRYLLDLTGRAASLPADCPATREEIELLPHATASTLINTLKSAPRRSIPAAASRKPSRPARAPLSRARRTGCSCASSLYGGICTCD